MNAGFLPHGFPCGFSTRRSKGYKNTDKLCVRLITSGNPTPAHSCAGADSALLICPSLWSS